MKLFPPFIFFFFSTKMERPPPRCAVCPQSGVVVHFRIYIYSPHIFEEAFSYTHCYSAQCCVMLRGRSNGAGGADGEEDSRLSIYKNSSILLLPWRVRTAKRRLKHHFLFVLKIFRAAVVTRPTVCYGSHSKYRCCH